MCDGTNKGFESLTKEEQRKVLIGNLDKFLVGTTEEDMSALMMGIMPKIMGVGMPTMQKMCQMMCSGMFGGQTYDTYKDATSSCCGENKESQFATPEIKSLFDDWVCQVKDEIDKFKKENKCASKADIAKYLKISEESLDYFIKDFPVEEASCCCNATCDSVDEDTKTAEFETIKIEKIKNVCSMCEDYAKQQAEKPIVIMSCEGACLRGEVSRHAANLICHSLAPNKTVRLCLGGAFTKDGGQRDLVRNAKRVIALEGCFIKCASRMMKGVVSEVDPEIIITDKLFSFDTNIFGINEMSEEDIKANSLEVARSIVDKLSKY